jgi:Arc/MetJ family transcription regulator
MSRTNIDIDDELMAAAMEATGQKTKKAAVEVALRSAVREERLR